MDKKLQLRGISRDPSNRMTEDGGLADCRNLEMRNGELCPVIAPKECSSRYGAEAGTTEYDRIWLLHQHKTANNLIVSKGSQVGWINTSTGRFSSLFSCGQANVHDVTSVGNMVIFSTENGMRYVLWKNGEYRYLGDRIPFPSIRLGNRLVPTQMDNATADKACYLMAEEYDPAASDYKKLCEIDYTKIVDGQLYDTSVEKDNLHWAVMNREKALGLVGKIEQTNSYFGFFCHPVFARYSVKLATGGRINSVPFLIGGGRANPYEFFVNFYRQMPYVENNTHSVMVTAELKNDPYMLTAKLISNEDFSSWSDIVDSIEIYVSTDIETDWRNTLVRPHDTEITDIADGGSEHGHVFYHTHPFTMGGDPSTRSAMLAASNYYLVHTIAISDLASYRTEKDIDCSGKVKQEDRVLLDTLDVSYDLRAHSTVIPDTLSTYNGRLLMDNAIEILPGEPKLLTSDCTVPDSQALDSYTYRIKYELSTTEGTNVVEITGLQHRGAHNISYGWFAYPDTRCTKVQISAYSGGTRVKSITLPMQPHPFLPGIAYAIIDLKTPLHEYMASVADNMGITGSENRVVKDGTMIYQSEVNSPLVFTNAAHYPIDARVIDFVPATIQLSENQSGRFPLYIFTDEGVFALQVNNDGTFSHARETVTREIVTNKATITRLDQSVLFMTAKGLMLLNNSDVTCLSPFMNGKTDEILADYPAVRTIVSQATGTQWNAQSESFRSFMQDEDTFLMYDYIGKRVICCNSDCAHQYIFQLESSTWHKMDSMLGSTMKPSMALNSYPEAVAMFNSAGKSYLYDFSTVLDVDTNDDDIDIYLATRPFDLDAPDIRKNIRRILPRGAYHRGDIKTLLLASNDGENYDIVRSLWGNSARLFRLVVAGKMKPTDSLSWIDIDYITKLANKQRM